MTTLNHPITRKPEEAIDTFAIEAQEKGGRFVDLSRRDKVRAVFATFEAAWEFEHALRRQGVRATFRGRNKLGGFTVELTWGRALL